MTRAERRKLLSGTSRLAPKAMKLSDLEDEGAKRLLVGICRAILPSAADELFTDAALVEAVYELVAGGFLDVHIRWLKDGYGCDVFSEMKIPGKGPVSLMGPIPAVRYAPGGVH